MNSTGIEAVDGRLGGLEAGSTYAFFGPPAAGKSVLGLHFLISGLERGERCILVTREDDASIDSRAAYLGHGPGTLSEHPQFRIVRLPEPDARLAGRPGEGYGLVQWLGREIGRDPAARLVLDDVDSLADYSDTPRAQLQDLMRLAARTGATIYALVRTDRDATFDRTTYQPLLEHAAGVFRLQVDEQGERRFLCHVPPTRAFRTEPFVYTLRIGAGFTEEMSLGVTELSDEDRRRVVIIDEPGAIGSDVLTGLESLYDTVVLTTATGALGRLAGMRYGALVLAVDPFDETRAFDLVFALRKEGNASPIVLVAPSRGLRSTTRARGLRVGGDDFCVADMPASELVERIQMAWLRGSHRRRALSHVGQIIQPVNGNGARPMTRAEFLQAMDTLLAEQPALFFCYLEFTMREGDPDLVWPALRTRVRVGDGDIIGLLSDRTFACVLDRITPDQTWRVVERIRAAHPALASMSDVVVVASPMHADRVRRHLAERTDAAPAALQG
ncbi:MAG TPA: RAD55 family ATPase [Longimicrobiales bacterium]